MADKKTIRVLESVPNATRFSKYNQSLDRLFKSRSLKDLLESLKSPHKKHIYNEKPETPKKNNKEFNENSEKVLNDLYKQKLKEQELIKKQERRLLSERRENKHSHFKNKIIEPILDPFKYCPNYDSVKPRSPCYKITLPTIPSKKINNKSTKSLENIDEYPSKIKLKKNRNDDINLPSLKTEESEKSTIDPVKKNNGLYINCDKNNHALRFSKYAARGDFLEMKGGTVSYVEPHNYNFEKKNNAIDFQKMQKFERSLVNKEALDTPSMWFYNPKYDLVEKKPVEITFGKNNDKRRNKQYLLRKIWGSYYATIDYSIVNNNMLK